MQHCRFLLIALTAPLAHAQFFPAPPRITSLKGTVTVRHGDSGAEVPGAANTALAAGDRLSTASGARAEVQFDNRVFQLAADTDVRLVRMDSGAYQLALDKGSLTCQVVDVPATVVGLNTPSVSVNPEGVGVYRIAVTAAGESQIVAQEGNVEVSAPAGSEWVLAGQKMLAHGPSDNPEFKIVSAVSKWRKALSIALMSIRIAGDVSVAASSGGGGLHPAPKGAAASNTATARTPSNAPRSPSSSPASGGRAK